MVSFSCYNLTDDLTVESKSYPSEQTQLIVSENMQVRRGGDVSLECKVISDPHIKCRVQWEHNGSPIKTSASPRYHLVDSPPTYSLRISEVQEGDVGVYRCVASSVFHEVEGQGEVELTLQGVLIGTSYAVSLDPPPVLCSHWNGREGLGLRPFTSVIPSKLTGKEGERAKYIATS